MRYVIAGYVIVLGTLFLYAVQLAWRRRRLTRAAARIAAAASTAPYASAPDAGAIGTPDAGAIGTPDAGPVGNPDAATAGRRP